jgi:hypothetical protein
MNRIHFIAIIFLLMFFSAAPNSCCAQLKVKCCGMDETIPVFVDNVTEYNDSILMEKLFIPSIHESKSAFEIRFFSSHPNIKTAVIIKCINDSIKVTRYMTFLMNSNKPIKGSLYINMGELNDHPGYYAFIKTTRNLKFEGGISGNDFLNKLIKNHLFDIP